VNSVARVITSDRPGGAAFGAGFGVINSALNAYHFGARDVSWMYASYALGATIGPLLVTALLGARCGPPLLARVPSITNGSRRTLPPSVSGDHEALSVPRKEPGQGGVSR
jgi:hypothetical protein